MHPHYGAYSFKSTKSAPETLAVCKYQGNRTLGQSTGSQFCIHKQHQQQQTVLIGRGGLLTSWLAAHLVQAAAGTHTAADEDEHSGDGATDTKDHGHW